MKYLVFIFLLSAMTLTPEGAAATDEIRIFGKFEYGFFSVLSHKSQWGKQGSEFNYVLDGGQDLLFPTWRVELGASSGRYHRFSFLYQPIFLETEVVLKKDLRIDDIVFARNTDLLVTYDFPFYRFSYWYLISASEVTNFWLGGGLQIRNANIKFRDRRGSLAFRTSSLGPVPLVNLLLESRLSDRTTLYAALSGFWAPIKYLNGGKTDVNGWIYEFEPQIKLELDGAWSCFAGLRILGGGAVGNAREKRLSGGTLTKDTIVTSSLTAGATRAF